MISGGTHQSTGKIHPFITAQEASKGGKPRNGCWLPAEAELKQLRADW